MFKGALSLLAGWKGYAATALIAAAAAGAGTWTAQDWRLGAQIAAAERDKAVATSNAQASARAKDQEYAKLNARVDGQYLELAAAQLEAADLRTDLAAGNRRLSVRTVPGACRVPADTAGAGVDHEAARADIDSGDAVDIIAILARGDEAIRQLNALQDREEGMQRAK